MAKALTLACLMAVSSNYQVPLPVMQAILTVEGGKVGTVSQNTNGSRDMGPMQINSIWLPELAAKLGRTEPQVEYALTHDGCFNATVGAWILSKHIRDTGNVWRGVARYHSRTPDLGAAYLRRVQVAYVKAFYAHRRARRH
ncbi:MAG: hypothetical protein Alpg2KO_31930 [Alphaproteobacteria bacterium]